MYVDPDIPRLHSPESKGAVVDLKLLSEEDWMINTEVKYLIQPIRGRWHVWMIFFSLNEWIKLVVRCIDHYPSFAKAETYAQIFQRGIRKDARGTLNRKNHAYYICNN